MSLQSGTYKLMSGTEQQEDYQKKMVKWELFISPWWNRNQYYCKMI